jgi:hypothetical protein
VDKIQICRRPFTEQNIEHHHMNYAEYDYNVGATSRESQEVESRPS